jgi:hypothetical protein
LDLDVTLIVILRVTLYNVLRVSDYLFGSLSLPGKFIYRTSGRNSNNIILEYKITQLCANTDDSNSDGFFHLISFNSKVKV